MRGGVKMFGNEGIAAIYEEMKQFNYQKEITPEIKSKAVGYLMFLK